MTRFRSVLVLLIGGALVVGCTKRVELRRSPFITPLPEGKRPAIAAPAGSPAAEPAAEELVPPGSPAAKALAELQGAGEESGVRPVEATTTPRVDVEEEARRVAADPRNVASRLALARAYHEQRILDLALEHYEAARELAPEDPEIARDIGRLWLDAGEPALSLAFLGEALRARPLDAEAWSYRGIALDLLSRYLEGEEALRRAIALEPRRWDFRNNLGYNLLLQERYADAAEAFEEGLALAPGHPTLQNNLGLALGFEGLPEEALAAFRGAGSEAAAWNNLGVVHRHRGEVREAEAAFSRAAQLDPGSREIARNLRQVRLQLAAVGEPRVAEPVAIGARLPEPDVPPVPVAPVRIPAVSAKPLPPAPAAPAGAAPTTHGAPAPSTYRLELLRVTSEEVALRAAAALERRWGVRVRVKQSEDLYMVQTGGLTLARAEALHRAVLAAGYRSARVLDAWGNDVPSQAINSPTTGSR